MVLEKGTPRMKLKIFFFGGGNSNIFEIFTPKFGEMIQFDEHIFEMGGSTTN